MHSLAITQVSLWLCGIDMDFTYSTGHMSLGQCLIIEIRAGDLVGIGECNARPDQTWEVAVRTAHQLIGADAFRIEALLGSLSCANRWELLAREGLSIALYDLVGRATGAPVYVLLGGQRRNGVPGMPVVHVATPEVMARRARKWTDAGYRFLKVKLRGTAREDIAAVNAIRATVGEDIDLQVDANRGYQSEAEVVEAMRAMEAARISILEDPMQGDLYSLARVRARVRPSLMVDAEAWWPNVYQAVAIGAADVINQHPNRQGGLGTALQINAVASSAGLVTAIGSCGLLGIQNAAFQSLATVIGLERPCEDIGLLEYYEGAVAGEYTWGGRPSVVKEAYPVHEGRIHVPDAPGLGVELDVDKLSQYVTQHAVVTSD